MTIKRDTFKIDVTGKSIGRSATEIAMHLMGKHKPGYAPNVDSGDFVEVTGMADVSFTGKKLEQKVHYTHSNHPGGLKRLPLKKTMETNPGIALYKAVDRMLPKNKHRQPRLNRLKIS